MTDRIQNSTAPFFKYAKCQKNTKSDSMETIILSNIPRIKLDFIVDSL